MPLNLDNIDLGGFDAGDNQQQPEVNNNLRSTMSEAVKVNPEQHSKVTDLSKKSGIPEFAVESNPEEVETKLKLDNVDFSQMSQRSPNTAKYLTDFNNAVIAQDDIDVLESIEGLLTNTFQTMSNVANSVVTSIPTTPPDMSKTFSNLGESISLSFDKQLKGGLLAGVDLTPSKISDLIPVSALPIGMEQVAVDESIKLAARMGINTDEELQRVKQESTDSLISQIHEINQNISDITPSDLTILEQGIRGGVESLVNMAPGFSLMLLSGGRAAPLLATIGAQTFGSSFGEARAEGLSSSESTLFAGIDAAIEVGTELLPTGVLETILTGQSKGLKKEALKFVVREMGTEQIATLGQSINSFAFGLDDELQNAQSVSEMIDIQLQRQAVTAIATVVAGGGQIAAVASIRKTIDAVTRNEEKIETKSEAEQQKIDDINEKAQQAKVRDLNKESFKEFVDQADGENNTHVFVDGVQTSLYLQTKTPEEIEADSALKMLSEQAREAAALGVDVQIPIADFAADITGSDHFTALRDSMTMSEDSISPFRQEQVKQETDNYIESLVQEAETNVSQYVEAQEIFNTVKDQLIDSGRINSSNASIMATVVPAWATAHAARTGKTVQQIYSESGLVIEGPQTGERARLDNERQSIDAQQQTVAIEPVNVERRENDTAPEVEQRQENSDRRSPTQSKARALFDEMSRGDLINEILKHELTGIKGRKAFVVDVQDAPVIGSIDADSLKWVNDNLSPDHGDALLQAVADSLEAESESAYHISGDEFYVLGQTQEEVSSAIDKAVETLSKAVVTATKPDGTVITLNGLNITKGIGVTKDEADIKLKKEKVSKEESGQRASRGEQPFGSTIEPASGNQVDGGDQVTFLQSEVDTNSDAFEKWSGGGEVIEPEDVNDYIFKADTPVVVKVFHGTTHDFSVFDATRGNLEGQFGAINYFTSSEFDASENYAGEGPDLTNRIDNRAEPLADEIQDTIEEFENEEEGIQAAKDKYGEEHFDEDTKEFAINIAREELSGGQDQTMELFVRVDNPFVIGENAEWIELVDNEEIRNQAEQQVADDNSIEVRELVNNFEEYEEQVDEKRWEIESETPNELIEAIQLVSDRNGVDAAELSSQVYDLGSEAKPESIENLLRESEDYQYAEDPESGELINSQLVAEVIQELGFDSIILRNAESRFSNMNIVDGTAHVHIFDSGKTNIKSVENTGAFDPENPDIFKQKDNNQTRGYYDPQNSVIRLTESSDLSTFLHEFAHFMYEMEVGNNTDMLQSINKWFKRNAADVAEEANGYLGDEFDVLKQGDEPKSIKGSITADDVATFLDQSTTGDKSKDAAIRRAVHEQFARGFETYLMEGKAPSIELRNAFRTFARWLSNIYQQLRGQLNVNLDAEMREVFDRLLATEEQIQAAQARARVEPLFTDAAMAGMTDDEFADYKKRQEKVKDVQSETLRDKIIAQLTRQKKKWWKEEKQDVIDEEIESLSKERVYAARDRLKAVVSTTGQDEQINEINENIKEVEKSADTVNKENDTVGQYISKQGGLNRESFLAEGIDKDHFKDKTKVFGKPLFPKKGGMKPDDLAENLNELNYNGGNLTADDALDIVNDMLFDDSTFIDLDANGQIESLDRELDALENQKADLQRESEELNIKLDHATVKEMIGEQRVDKRGIKSTIIPPALSKMTAKGQQGVHPDEAAAFFGYRSGDELLTDLVTAPKIDIQAGINAEQIMIERHGDILTDGTIEREADEAVQDEERGKLLLHELKMLSRGTNAPAIERATIKAIAEERIGRLSFREIHPGKYRSAEIRAAQESARMLAEGNKQGAADAKTRQVMNHYLGMAATNAKNDTMTIVDRMSRYNKKKVRESIQKADGGYWDQIVKILQRFEFRKSATLKSVESINTWAKTRMEEHGDGLELSDSVINESFVTHWKNIPFSELLGIRDSVQNIEYVAKKANEIRLLDEKVDFQKLKVRIIDQLDTLKVRYKPVRSTGKGVTGFSNLDELKSSAEAISKWVREEESGLVKISDLMVFIDHNDPTGLFSTLFTKSTTEALDEKLNLFESTVIPLLEKINERDKKDSARMSRKIYIPEIDDSLYGNQILSVFLNAGNKSNLRKMLIGEGWAEDNDIEITTDNQQLQAIFKHLTKSDVEIAQLIWDAMDTLYPLLSETSKESSGNTPPRVEASPFTLTLSDGEVMNVKGGYYVMEYDPKRSPQAAEFREKRIASLQSPFTTLGSIQQSSTAGSVNERTKFTAPVLFDLSVINSHFEEVIQYITHFDKVKQLAKIINDKEIRSKLDERVGEGTGQLLSRWLSSVAKQDRIPEPKVFLGDVATHLKNGMTYVYLGFKLSTIWLQPGGLVNAIPDLGSSYVGKGVKLMFETMPLNKNNDTGWTARDFALFHSKVLRHRIKSFDREYSDANKRLMGKTGKLNLARSASMAGLGYVQLYMVDMPTWHGAYLKEMDNSGDHNKAVQFADFIVDSTQGTGSIAKTAEFLRSKNPWFRALTSFMTFFSARYNLSRRLILSSSEGDVGVAKVAGTLVFIYVANALYELAVRGQLFPDDDDNEDHLVKVAKAIALSPTADIPIVRDVINSMTTGYKYNPSPIISILDNGIGAMRSGLESDGLTRHKLKSLVIFTGTALKIPGTAQGWATGEHLYEIIEEGEDFNLRELQFGPKRD